ncbi:MAG: hypothetical protein OEU32_19460 [Acidimicrobiia bacterium]|nr:hypothetical protein [Acidimicrobiia bacterium]
MRRQFQTIAALIRARSARVGRARTGERGATIVEYGLVVALVVAVSVLAIDGLTDTSTDALEARGDRIGNPSNDATGVADGTDTGTTIGEDIETSDPIVEVKLDDIQNRRSLGDGPKWQASVDVIVTTISGSQVTGAVVNGTWYPSTGPLAGGAAVTCTTDATGLCTMTVDGLQNSGASQVHNVSFEFVSIDADGVTTSYTGLLDTTAYGTPPSVLVCQPGLTLLEDPPNPDTCI